MNEYIGSKAVLTAGLGGRIVFTDIDNTFLAPEFSEAQIAAAGESRAICNQRGAFVAVTAQTPEMLLSTEMLRASQMRGFNRPAPQIAVENGQRAYAPPEKYPHLGPKLDPDALYSFGCGIYVRNNGAYLPDRNFNGAFEDTWRLQTMALLDCIDLEEIVQDAYDEIEDESNFHAGKTDVIPLPLRVTLRFYGTEGLMWKKEIKKRINKLLALRYKNSHQRPSLRMVDESNPELEVYTLYLVPRLAGKERAVNRILDATASALQMPASAFEEVSYMGDSLTDVCAGLYAGRSCKNFTFFLAGGSRVTEYLIGARRGQHFAGENLWWILKYLNKTERKGEYVFKAPGCTPRRVIIGDEAYGLQYSESVLAFLKSRR